jgi:integrase
MVCPNGWTLRHSQCISEKLRYLKTDTSQHGTERVFVRRFGRTIRLRSKPGTKEFLTEYNAALEALEGDPASKPQPKTGAPPGTLGWLAAKYFDSVEFKAYPPAGRRMRRNSIEECLREPLKPDSKDVMAMVPTVLLAAQHLRVMRDRKADKPGAANNRLKFLGTMLSWAVENNMIRANPTRDVKPMRYATEGFHTWSAEEVAQFEAHHAIGTKPRLAFALMYYLGVRRSDAILLGRQHVRNGRVRFVPQKTRHKKLDVIELPLPSELAAIIEATPSGDMTFLITEYGKPFTVEGFGNWFRDQCDYAGLPQCSSHGLRKALACILADRGATDRQLMAVFGWESEKQATKYTKAANRKRLAAAAMRLEDQIENDDCLTQLSHPKTA